MLYQHRAASAAIVGSTRRTRWAPVVRASETPKRSDLIRDRKTLVSSRLLSLPLSCWDLPPPSNPPSSPSAFSHLRRVSSLLNLSTCFLLFVVFPCLPLLFTSLPRPLNLSPRFNYPRSLPRRIAPFYLHLASFHFQFLLSVFFSGFVSFSFLFFFFSLLI